MVRRPVISVTYQQLPPFGYRAVRSEYVPTIRAPIFGLSQGPNQRPLCQEHPTLLRPYATLSMRCGSASAETHIGADIHIDGLP